MDILYFLNLPLDQLFNGIHTQGTGRCHALVVEHVLLVHLKGDHFGWKLLHLLVSHAVEYGILEYLSGILPEVGIELESL